MTCLDFVSLFSIVYPFVKDNLLQSDYPSQAKHSAQVSALSNVLPNNCIEHNQRSELAYHTHLDDDKRISSSHRLAENRARRQAKDPAIPAQHFCLDLGALLPTGLRATHGSRRQTARDKTLRKAL